MRSVYRATFQSMPGLAAVLALVGALFIAIGFLASSPGVACLGLPPLILLFAMRLRLRVVLTPETLAYTGLVATKYVVFSEIASVRRSAGTGYLATRWFGPFVYELRTPSQTVRVNLKLFPAELGQELFGALKARGLVE